ncbi:hypothetical protein CFP56_021288 [Quercus suber]|uniref:Uncharacterized protein n=1 Tax=Quercus suber TaxID=58331 RepID=A0AAW0KES6_QUESU
MWTLQKRSWGIHLLVFQLRLQPSHRMRFFSTITMEAEFHDHPCDAKVEVTKVTKRINSTAFQAAKLGNYGYCRFWERVTLHILTYPKRSYKFLCPYSCVKRAPHAFSFEKRHKLPVWLFILKKKGFQFGSSSSIITTINMNLIQ